MSNSFEEIIQPFNIDSDTFYMKKTLQIPISLDIMNYNYTTGYPDKVTLE